MSENLDPNYVGEDIYKENILDHYKHPHNKGTIDNPDVSQTENNPVCGDTITVNMKISAGKIADLKFSGRGCAISQAAMSMLSDELVGKTTEDAKNMKTADIVDMLGISIGPVRTKCAVLGLVAVQRGLK